MATSTYMTFLMHKAGAGSWTKLVDIKSFGDLGGKPDQLETTTMSNKMKTYINGLEDTDAIEFTSNYDKTEFGTLKALEGKDEDYAVWFGGTESDGEITPTGSDGKFSWKGQLSCYVAGKDVNNVRDTNISISAGTDIKFE